MKRTRLLAVLAIAMVAGLLFTGCQDPMDFDSDANIAWHWVSQPVVHTLWAGQHINAGTVTVWSTEETLFVRYDMAENWWLEETHAHVAQTLKGIPQTKKGNPIPGQFEFKDDWDPRVKTCTYAIPVRTGWEPPVCLYIATHAVAVEMVNGTVKQRQTGWAGDREFPGKNWALYFKYCRRLDRKDVTLPTEWVTMVAHNTSKNPGAESYWLVTLSDVPGDPGDYDVWNGDWLGWCGEMWVGLTPDVPYSIRLWSSILPGLPPRLQHDRWDNINYLLNHKHPDATAMDIQTAIWLIRGDLKVLPTGYPLSLEMYNDAMLNGNDWYPGSGDWIAVILETPERVQLCFIEVDP